MKKNILHLTKMRTVVKSPIEYSLGETLVLNSVLNQSLHIKYLGKIKCMQCDRIINKSFQQGYCFPCYRRLLECNLCVIHPEKCRYYEGKCDANDWVHSHCGQPHIVYLANSSGLKVGITRASQVPTRWIDQGATQGLPIFKVSNRYLAGLIESHLKQSIADKTLWQAMLKGNNDEINLSNKRDEIFRTHGKQLQTLTNQYSNEDIFLSSEPIVSLNYPVLQFPKKIKSFDLEKHPEVSGVLLGIKGQYLIFDSGVINVRKFGGYHVEISHD